MLEPSRQIHTPDAPSLQAKRVVEPVTGLGGLPDLLLVERTRGRDTRAFETLMRRYNRRLYRIARSILSSDDAAEEAVRAAHVRAHANLDRYEPAGKFGAWLARLAFNEALTLRKGPATGPNATPNAITASTVRATNTAGSGVTGSPLTVVTPVASATIDAMEVADATGTRQQLERAIDALPEVFRTVLVLRVIEELSGVEVAVCLGLNETTVRTRLYRAQQRLKPDVATRLRAEPFNVFELTPDRCDRIVSYVFARLHNGASPSESQATSHIK
jgi:RNA polymerase sigma-70 factor (ECF subfamily)